MLLEMEELLRTAGVATVTTIVQHRAAPHPSTYLGPGKLDELKDLCSRLRAEVVVCDDELTPRQQRRLEDELQSRVVDRTAVILDIFAQHAHTTEGKLQVELAQLEYNLQRMRGKPGGNGLHRAICKEIYRPATLQVTDQRPVALSAFPGPVIDAHNR